MSLSTSVAELQTILSQVQAEVASLEGGKKASSSRARKGLETIKKQSHALKKSIQTHVKSLPVRSRVKPEPIEPIDEPVVEPVKKIRKTRTKRVSPVDTLV